MLLIHIIIAVASLALTGWAYLSPSKRKLYSSYISVFLTLGTGFFLVMSKPAHMTQTCITGLIYLGFVVYGIASVHHKLAASPQK
jgi:hypothetical protein